MKLSIEEKVARNRWKLAAVEAYHAAEAKALSEGASAADAAELGWLAREDVRLSALSLALAEERDRCVAAHKLNMQQRQENTTNV